MLLFIAANECEQCVRDNPHMLNHMYNAGIDYATNDITGFYEERGYCLLRFENFGIHLDNRWNTYEISLSSIGITIEILTTR